jgi:hypothetical protein
MLDALLDRLLKEGQEIMKAPLLFGVAVLFVSIIVWGLLEFLHHERNARLEATIVSSQAAGQLKEERIALLQLKIDQDKSAIEAYKSTAEHLSNNATQALRGSPAKISTSLSLQFYDDERAPVAVSLENVLGWYSAWSASAQISFKDAEGKDMVGQGLRLPKTWTIFIIFNSNINIQQLVVEPSCANFPPHEVKWASSIYAIVMITGHVPSCVVRFYAKLND